MNYISELCKDLELDQELEKTEEGFSLLPINKELTVQIKPLDEGVFFYSPITSLPTVKQEDFFMRVMKANLFGQGTFGAVVALDQEEKLLTLSMALPYDMNYRTFKESLEDFSNMVEYWREEVNHHIKLSQEGIL